MKLSEAAILHRNVPPDWYQRGIKENFFQKVWHYFRFKNLGKLIEPSRGKILDIGCADGTATKFILEQSKADLIIGVDVLQSSVDYAKKRFKSSKLKFLMADAEKLPFEKNQFEAVFCLDSIEHFFEPEKVIREMRRVLKKDGYLVILVHTKSLLFRIIWFFWENTKGWVWKGTHIRKFSAEQLKKLIKNAGFEMIVERRFLLGMYQMVKARKK
jgi:ubiquinone/menaquinone biosynthesis C-methylase UbiE